MIRLLLTHIHSEDIFNFQRQFIFHFLHFQCQSETATPRNKHPLSIAKLADDGMTSARENVSRRLSYKDSNGNTQLADAAPPTDDEDKKSRSKEMKVKLENYNIVIVYKLFFPTKPYISYEILCRKWS